MNLSDFYTVFTFWAVFSHNAMEKKVIYSPWTPIGSCYFWNTNYHNLFSNGYASKGKSFQWCKAKTHPRDERSHE